MCTIPVVALLSLASPSETRNPPHSRSYASRYHYQVDKELFLAAEGMYTGQSVYCGKKAEISVGNVIPLREMPEGTVICNVEQKVGDRGSLARCSGDYATVIGHSDDHSMTFIRLPSGIKKTVQSSCRAMVGIIAGGGRMDKPMLKAGRAYHKYHVKRNEWPKVRGVCMNPVDHPHGGGEGKNKTSGRHPVSPWGVPTKGHRTRNPKKASSRLIIRRRKK